MILRSGFLRGTCCALLLAMVAYQPSSAFAAGTGQQDAAKEAPDAASAPSRVISIGGAVTEILYALGLEKSVIAVDTTSLYPSEALQQKPNVGYMRQLSPEGVLGLNPDMILAIEGSGPKDTISILSAAKVPFHLVPEIFTEENIVDKIGIIAKHMHAEKQGACLMDAVSSDLAAMKRLREKVTSPVRVMFTMSMLGGKVNVAGRNTAADAIIKLAGGVNAVDDYAGYKPITEEAIGAARPDVILSMSRGNASLTPESVFSQPAFALTPAAKTKSLIVMDGHYLLGFGPRTASAAHDLAAKLYPKVVAEAGSWATKADTVDCRH